MNDKQQLQALGAEHAQRFDADLDWLARNVHEWKGDDCKFIYAYHSAEGVFAMWLYGKDSVCQRKTFTKSQWEAIRARLQNKPSWDDAPAWAEWLAQHSTGYWCWGRGEAKQASNDLWYSQEMGTAEWSGMGGEVLGDWSDTLERRPNGTQQPAIKEEWCRSIGAEEAEAVEQHFLALLKSSPRWLDSGTLAEIVELADAELVKRDDAVCGGQMPLDAHWFERGELPPVGTVCVYENRFCDPKNRPQPKDGTIVTVIAHHQFCNDWAYVAAYAWLDEDDDGEEFGFVSTATAKSFRPIQTERQRVASEMVDVMMAMPVSELKTGSEHAMDMALAIYDRFLSKQGGDNADTAAPL